MRTPCCFRQCGRTTSSLEVAWVRGFTGGLRGPAADRRGTRKCSQTIFPQVSRPLTCSFRWLRAHRRPGGTAWGLEWLGDASEWKLRPWISEPPRRCAPAPCSHFGQRLSRQKTVAASPASSCVEPAKMLSTQPVVPCQPLV